MNQQPMMPQAPAPQFPPVMPQAQKVLGQPRPQQPAERAVDEVEASITALEHAVERLIDRIGPALTPQAPQASVPVRGENLEPPRSELVMALNAKNDALQDLLRRVEAISARVEL